MAERAAATARALTLHHERALVGAALAAIALLPVLLSLHFLGEPLEQDEGVYFAMAKWGGLPYTSVFDHKPPVIFGWYKLALLLGGGGDSSVEAVRLLAALNLSAAALAVTWLGWMLGGRKLGLLAGFILAASTANQYLQFNANTEAFMVTPLALSLCAFLRGREGIGWYALAGALAGYAAMTKPVGMLHAGTLVGVLAWAAWIGLLRPRDALRASAAVAAGVAAVVLAFLSPFALTGNLDELVDANITYNMIYSAQNDIGEKIYALPEVDRQVLVGALPLWVLAGAGLVIVWMRGADLAGGVIVGGAAAAFAGASLSGREYPHYWVPLLPFAALLAAVAIDTLTQRWREVRYRVQAEALLAVLAIPSIAVVVPLYLMSVEKAHLRKYDDGVNAARAVVNDDVASYVRSLSGPGDRMFNFGVEAQLYFLADRAPATYYTRPVAALQTRRSTFERTMRELRASPPEVIVDSARIELRASTSGGLSGSGQTIDVADRYRAEMDAFIEERYRLAGRVAYADVYVLR